VGLERGPLSLVSTTEELLRRKSSGSGLENLILSTHLRLGLSSGLFPTYSNYMMSK
jgi:hypothetical protein